MTDKQPALFDWATELSDAQGHVTLSEQEAHEIGARLRRLHSENETLQAGYAAARLEIASLQARIKTMAEVHLYELAMAHLDGRMRGRSTEPAGEYPELPVPVFESWAQGGLLSEAGFTADQMRAYADATCAMRAAQPENLHCKSTQKRLATQWGFVPAGAQQPGAAYATLSDAEIDRIVPALEPVSEDFPAEWAVWKDRERIREELRASHGQAPAQAAPAAVAGPSEFPHEQMDAVALARYKVVPSHESMFYRHAVVAGDGSQQLYIGREAECQNMARKFAGAFLDGAFAFHSMLAAAPATQQAPQQDAQEPVAWYVIGCGRLLDEDEAKAEARHIGGTARAMPLYTAPQADSVLEDAARYRWLREHRSIDLHTNPSVPWVVRCEFQPIPTTTAIVGEALDAAIDAARAAQEDKSHGLKT